MRKEIFRAHHDDALALLARAPVVHMASTTNDGTPVLRTVHGVLYDGWLAFHGAPAGEKIACEGREAVFAAEEIVASIPSYFVDPERACPATTLYRSVQVHGTVTRFDDPARKAGVLRALMARFQPEGGFVPIAEDHPLYRKAIDGILVLGVALDRVDAKSKLAQNRTPPERARILEGLWHRGSPGDAEAIEAIRAAAPDTPTPAFLAAPAGVTLWIAPTERDLATAVELLREVYWNVGIPDETLARAHRRSTWVCARDASGTLIASARALTDGAKFANVYDVVVAPGWRRRGVGDAVVRLLLGHPAVRDARRVWLRTRDAQRLYARMGFIDGALEPPRPYAFSEMVLLRAT